MSAKDTSKGRSGTGKSRRPDRGTGSAKRPAPAGGPNPAAIAGVALVVLALLGLALFSAFKSPEEPSLAQASPTASDGAIAALTPVETGKVLFKSSPVAKTSREDETEDLEAMLGRAEPRVSQTPSEEPEEPDEPEAPRASATPEVLEAGVGPGPALTGAPAKVPFLGVTEEVELKRVIDGDTLDLTDGRRIRLLGINTPEIGRTFKTDATDALKALTKSGKLTIEYDGPKDKAIGRYKRTLAYVHCDGVFVNGEIVRRGLAYIYIYPNTKAHNKELISYQREAREAKRYLWTKPLPEPAGTYIGNRRAPYFHREGCDRIKRLKGADKVEFKSRNEALDSGMNPCDDCKT